MKVCKYVIISLTLLSCTFTQPNAEPYSQLWGKNGELWSPESRLPDVSYAGYHHGENPIPNVPVAANIKDFGASGDDKKDDTEAFNKAIAETNNGAILIPNGKYIISDIIEITKPNLVLRGESRDGAILYFTKELQEVRPNWGATTGGQKTSNYSWSGGFIWAKGNFQSKKLADVSQPAKRSDIWITVSSNNDMKVGQWVDIKQRDTADNSLALHLYTNDSGNMDKILGRTRTSHVSKITAIDGNRIQLEHPLRNDLKQEWQAAVHAFEPTVTEVGIENLTFEFPVKPYQGHFTELGMNAIAFSNVAHSWVKNIRILHSDSGIFFRSQFCTIDGVLLQSKRPGDRRDDTGHHGIEIGGNDNLCTNFDFQTTFIHDLTVSNCAGNVFSNGRGINLSMDHHKRVPYANVFTNLDAGKGTNLWRCGGGADLGKHCAAWGTFWNIRTNSPIEYPRENFGPWSMNLVGLNSRQKTTTSPDGKWFELINPNELHPKNIHEAQLKKRLNNE